MEKTRHNISKPVKKFAMSRRHRFLAALVVIVANLVVGNGLFLWFNEGPMFDADFVNPAALIGSVGCLIVFSIFFWLIEFYNLSSLQLFFAAFFCCISVVFVGMGAVILYTFSIDNNAFGGFSGSLAATFFTGILGSLIFAPFIILLCIINFILLLIFSNKWKKPVFNAI